MLPVDVKGTINKAFSRLQKNDVEESTDAKTLTWGRKSQVKQTA
jgi:hypothetical protein